MIKQLLIGVVLGIVVHPVCALDANTLVVGDRHNRVVSSQAVQSTADTVSQEHSVSTTLLHSSFLNKATRLTALGVGVLTVIAKTILKKQEVSRDFVFGCAKIGALFVASVKILQCLVRQDEDKAQRKSTFSQKKHEYIYSVIDPLFAPIVCAVALYYIYDIQKDKFSNLWGTIVYNSRGPSWGDVDSNGD